MQSILASVWVGRVSTLPADSLDPLRAQQSFHLLRETFALETRLQTERETISAALHAAIGETDAPARKALIQLRRDLFNLRDPGLDRSSLAHAQLSSELRAQLQTFVDCLGELASLRARFATAYRMDASNGRAALRQAVADRYFDRGLLVSSRSLFEALYKYLHVAGYEQAGGQTNKTERGLLRYLARASVKATPFSSFCTILPGRWHEGRAADGGGPHPLCFEGNHAPEGRIRLNKGLYPLLWNHLLRRAAVREQLPVEVNPTLTAETGGLVFLAADHGREVFRRMEPDGVVELVRELVAAQVPPRLSELLEAITTHPDVDATREETVAYVDYLLRQGFLRFVLGIPDQQADWDRSLVAILASVEDEDARRIVALLRRLRAAADRFGAADAPERAVVLDSVRTDLATEFASMGIPDATHLLVFMEDTTSPGCSIRCHTEELRTAIATLHTYVGLTRRLAAPRAEQATMAHWFRAYYGDSGDRGIPLLRFYEDFHREHLKKHLEIAAAVERGTPAPAGYDLSNPFGLSSVQALRDARGRLIQAICAAWAREPTAKEITVDMPAFAAAIGNIPPDPGGPSSIALLADVVPASAGKPATLILGKGGYETGFGKLFSRFVYLFPEEFRDTLLAEHGHLGGGLLAEVSGDGNFNANLHPPLVGWELSYPSGEADRTANRITTDDLVVRPAVGTEHALELRSISLGARVFPVDLGFAIRSSRPGLYQLLSRFTPASEFKLLIPGSLPPLADSSAAAGAISYRPRITVSGSLVLARRSWTLPARIFPTRTKAEDASAFFARINRWREEVGIPVQCFVRGVAPGAGSAVRASARPSQRVLQNLAKPQFVDFGSPAFVELLGSLVNEELESVLVIEERYPALADLPVWSGRPHAVELTLQVNIASNIEVPEP